MPFEFLEELQCLAVVDNKNVAKLKNLCSVFDNKGGGNYYHPQDYKYSNTIPFHSTILLLMWVRNIL